MNVFEKVNNLTAAQILARVHLDTAADGRSYVCPNPDCGHGKGGDGIKPQILKGQTIWHCYGKCGRHYTNSDLAAMTQGVDASIDRAAAAKVLSELFELESDDDGDFVATRNYRQSARAKVNLGADDMDKENLAVELKNFSGLYKFCRGNVAKFLAGHGGQFRGFKPATFKKFGIGVHDEFEFPGGQGKGAAIIIPYVTGTKVDDYHFLARSVEDINGERGFAQIGKNPPLFEPMPLVTDGVNFICESATDALSIAQVFDGYDYVGCVASSGASKRHAFINRLNERFANAERRPRFVCVFDNDETGIEDSKQLVEELRKAGYPATVFFFEGQPSGTYEFQRGGEVETVTIPKVDANDLLKQGGGKLFERLLDAITQTTNTLDEQAAAIQASQESMKINATEPTDKATEPPQPPPEKSARAFEQSGITSVSLGEYFSDKFLLDVSQLEKYAGRKTGFSNLDEELKALPPGLIVIGGLPATGKTTFANQLAQNFAANGEYVFYCSYEMSALELMSKVVARELFKLKRSGRDIIAPTSFDIRRGYVNHLIEVQNLVHVLSASPAQFHVAELSNTPVNKLFEWLKPRIASATKSPVVIVDYLQIVPSDKNDRRDRRESLDNTIRSLKDFQREYGATFVVISSLNRQSYWDAISLESFKETGSLEFSADLLLGLETYVTDTGSRKEQILAAARKAERTIRLACLKNRNGCAFECFFRYHAAHDYFEPIDEHAANDAASVEDDDDVE